MAYGLIYNLNFSSNINDRKFLLSIYKDGHTATITTNDNNIIGTEEPVILIWDNNDDIYNNIMTSRLEINLYNDDVKQIDIADILSSTLQSKYKVQLSVENSSNVMIPYWIGYISNATFKQGISSSPKTYQLIATDLLGTLKNVYPTDGNAAIDSQPTVVEYIDNILGFLPQSLPYRVSSDFQLRPYKFFLNPADDPNQFTKMHRLQWLMPYKSGLSLAYDNAYSYIENTLKAFNSRMFYADGYFQVISNCSYKDTAEFDYFNTNGVYSSTSSTNVVKTIPTNLVPVNDDLEIRYDTPYDVVEVNISKNSYATNFDVNHIGAEIFNLTPYPSFETKPNGILFNSTYYSDNFSVINNASQVKVGNYAIKTANYILSGTPTQKIMDTGFQGDFQWDAADDIYFYASYYIDFSGNDTEDVTVYYSLLREVSSTTTGLNPTRSYYNGSSWVGYTNESQATKLSINQSSSPRDQWVQVTNTIQTSGTIQYARYRIILWQPKITGISTSMVVHFDEVLLSRRNSLQFEQPLRTVSRLAGSTRRNKKLSYDFDAIYPYSGYGTQVKTTDIDPNYLAQYNEVIAQQILNDNRSHIKRYTISCVPADNDQIIYPYHKIDIDFSNYGISETCIIDRMRFSAKSNTYELEFHETNQATNVSISTQYPSSVF